MDKKGICLDDTTFATCPGSLPRTWPNTQEPIQSMRMFKVWDKTWEGDRAAANDNVIAWAKSTGARLLVGVEVGCVKGDNEQGWEWMKEFLQKLGPDHLMGLAIGNELDLLQFKDREKFHISTECIDELWGWGQEDSGKESSYLYKWFTHIVTELDALPGFQNLTVPIPVTTVLSGLAMSTGLAGFMNGEPDQDRRFNYWYHGDWMGWIMVNDFITNITQTYGKRFAHSLNIYPYFSDVSNSMDFACATRCRHTVYTDLCFDDFGCSSIGQLAIFRWKIRDVTGRQNDTVWIGEFGWSYPMATTLKGEMTYCSDFNSRETFASAYQGWMSWNLTVPDGVVLPADHVFYFSIRDSINFGEKESFGLISSCGDDQCKLDCADGDCPDVHCWVKDPSGGQSCEKFEFCTPSWRLPLSVGVAVLLLFCLIQSTRCLVRRCLPKRASGRNAVAPVHDMHTADCHGALSGSAYMKF